MEEGNDCSIPVLDTGRKTRRSSHNSTKSRDVSGSATSTTSSVMPKCVTSQILRDLETTATCSGAQDAQLKPKHDNLHENPSQIGILRNMQSKEVKSSRTRTAGSLSKSRRLRVE
jgi:hypothetical protein